MITTLKKKSNKTPGMNKSNKNSKFNFFLMSFRINLIAILISISFIIAGSKIINTNINSKVKIETIPVKKITEEKVSVFRNYINEEVDQSIFFPVKNTYSDNNEANSKINIKNSLNLNFLENCWVEISSNNKFIICFDTSPISFKLYRIFSDII